MVLSDKTIKEEIKNKNIIIKPLGENAIQPGSVDVRLDENILVFRNTEQPYIYVKNIKWTSDEHDWKNKKNHNCNKHFEQYN